MEKLALSHKLGKDSGEYGGTTVAGDFEAWRSANRLGNKGGGQRVRSVEVGVGVSGGQC